MIYRIESVYEESWPLSSLKWQNVSSGVIGSEIWEGYCASPASTFKLVRYPSGFGVWMHSNETDLRAEVTEENGEVCEDSCMEMFIKPDIHDVNYMNFEINPKGVMHIGLGKDRYNRRLISVSRDVFHVETKITETGWTLKYDVPDSFLRGYFKETSPVFRGNFYKCGELTGHSHFASWAPVYTPQPDFHVPDFFGLLFVDAI